MIGIYFSGTGNTKHCIETFLAAYKNGIKMYSLEEPKTIQALKKNKDIILAYPIQYSNLPKIVRDFIVTNQDLWKGKQVYIIATMGLFSGDGAGLSARLLKKYGAKVVGGVHIKMPDCIGDVKALKRPLEENKELVMKAELKLKKAAMDLREGHPSKEGLGIFYHAAGLFGQRLYFYNKTKNYSNKLSIALEKCIGCGICQKGCPMHNIEIKNKKAEALGKCTMCYRCVNNCPKQAITLLGKNVMEQCKIERYL